MHAWYGECFCHAVCSLFYFSLAPNHSPPLLRVRHSYASWMLRLLLERWMCSWMVQSSWGIRCLQPSRTTCNCPQVTIGCRSRSLVEGSLQGCFHRRAQCSPVPSV